MQRNPGQSTERSRHRPRPFDPAPLRPAALTAAYRAAHPARLRAIGRSETREQRAKLARRLVARERFLADANRGSDRPLEVTS